MSTSGKTSLARWAGTQDVNFTYASVDSLILQGGWPPLVIGNKGKVCYRLFVMLNQCFHSTKHKMFSRSVAGLEVHNRAACLTLTRTVSRATDRHISLACLPITTQMSWHPWPLFSPTQSLINCSCSMHPQYQHTPQSTESFRWSLSLHIENGMLGKRIVY